VYGLEMTRYVATILDTVTRVSMICQYSNVYVQFNVIANLKCTFLRHNGSRRSSGGQHLCIW